MSHQDDSELPTSQMTLRQFVLTAGGLSRNLDNTGGTLAFIRFALAGLLQYQDQDIRIFLNAAQDVSINGKDFRRRSDVDSVIGISRNLPFKTPLAVFPLASFRDTLIANNHVRYKPEHTDPAAMVSSLRNADCVLDANMNKSEAKGISMHKIPNMALGKADRRQVTRIFFPWLYHKGKSPAISSELRAHIYECIRHAVLQIDPFDQGKWPITYAEAMKLCRDEKGQFHFGTLDLPAKNLGGFADGLLALLQEHGQLKDAFFLHEIRGIKGGYHHDDHSHEARQEALDGVFSTYDREQMKDSDWFVDIGTEIWCAGHTLQWMTGSHRSLLRYILSRASESQVDSVLSSSTQYHLDLSAQLTDLGGFRSSPASRGAADQVVYINVYTTDKSATYQLHNGLFKRRNGSHLFPENIGKLLKNMEKIADTFKICGGSQPLSGLEGNARMEVRVPLTVAATALLEMPDALIKSSVAAVDSHILW